MTRVLFLYSSNGSRMSCMTRERLSGSETLFPSLIDHGPADFPMCRKCFKPRRMGPKQLPKRAKNLMLHKRATHNPAKSWPQYQPCQCAGQCDIDCPCVQRGTWCEKVSSGTNPSSQIAEFPNQLLKMLSVYDS